MKKDNIDAVEMTRRIRDAHYQQLKGKTYRERIEFYRMKAQKLHRRIKGFGKDAPKMEHESEIALARMNTRH